MRLTLSLIAIAAASAAFAQTMGDPVATLTITKAVNNSPEFFANTTSDGSYNFGIPLVSRYVFSGSGGSGGSGGQAGDRTITGASNADWKITRTSSSNPGDLGVVIKVKTRAYTLSSYYSTGGTCGWRLIASIQGLEGPARNTWLEGNGSFTSTQSATLLDQTPGYSGYEDQPDRIIQLKAENWARVGTTDVWEAHVQQSCLVVANSLGTVSGSITGRVDVQGDTIMKLTFPGFSGGGGTPPGGGTSPGGGPSSPR